MKFNTERRLCGTKFGIVTLDKHEYRSNYDPALQKIISD